MTYTYKCNQCGETEDITIPTYDILDKYGKVDLRKLEERMYKVRECTCGGQLKKIITHTSEPLGFEYGMWGKVSQRFK